MDSFQSGINIPSRPKGKSGKKRKLNENPLRMPYNVNARPPQQSFMSSGPSMTNWRPIHNNFISTGAGNVSGFANKNMSQRFSNPVLQNNVTPNVPTQKKKRNKKRKKAKTESNQTKIDDHSNINNTPNVSRLLVGQNTSKPFSSNNVNLNKKKKSVGSEDRITSKIKQSNDSINKLQSEMQPFSMPLISEKHKSIISDHLKIIHHGNCDPHGSMFDGNIECSNNPPSTTTFLTTKCKNKSKSTKNQINMNEVNVSNNEKNKHESTSTDLVQSPKFNLNRLYSLPITKKIFNKNWNNTTATESFITESYKLLNLPFKCAILNNFITDCSLLDNILKELADLSLTAKNNDMYKFTMSHDLQNFKKPHIVGLYDLLSTKFKDVVSRMTGIKLLNKMSMSFSKYEYSDVLLCHNDQLEGRRIAYVLYLMPNWTEEDGGALNLFNADESCKPCNIVENILPKQNSLVFFEVTKNSFHQVSEILSKDKARLSINGWFYSDETDQKISYAPEPWDFFHSSSVDEDVIYSWINQTYLNEKTQLNIQKEFEMKSEIALEMFINENKFKELSDALKNCEWNFIGPPNFRHYQTASKCIPGIIQEFQCLMKSDAMFLILSQLTGVKLHHLYECDNLDDSLTDDIELDTKVFTQLRKWSPGCYTMIRDDDVTCRQHFALDAILHCNVPDNWQTGFGGNISYIAESENEELLTVTPKSNQMALVYRDKQTMKFSKYINSKSKSAFKPLTEYFNEIYCEYREDAKLLD